METHEELQCEQSQYCTVIMAVCDNMYVKNKNTDIYTIAGVDKTGVDETSSRQTRYTP